MEENEQLKATRISKDRVQKYDSPELYEFVVEGRVNGKTYENIADEIKNKFGYETITPLTVSNIYDRAITRTVSVEKRAGKKFTDFSKELDLMYKRAVKLMGRYIDALEKLIGLLEEAVEKSDEDDLTLINMQKKIVTSIPQAMNLFKELRSYMEFHNDQQERILLTQQQTQWDTQKLMDNLQIQLDNLEKDGYRIIKPNNSY